jgi:uncharacterized protein involved in exopolysaccharide biosynthesis
MIRITIESDELTGEIVQDLLGIPGQLRKIKQRLTQIEERIMGLEAEFGAFNEQLTRLFAEIDTQLAQLADAVAAGTADRQTVEDARARISTATGEVSAAADRLAADNPVSEAPTVEG